MSSSPSGAPTPTLRIPTDRTYDPDLTWREQSLCSEFDYTIFDEETVRNVRIAKQICDACPVRRQCLEVALKNHERYGIWGGLSSRERKALLSTQGTPARRRAGTLRARAARTTQPHYARAARLERDRQVAALYHDKVPIPDIALALNVTERTVYRALQRVAA